jgi:hypothetical protein
MKPSTVHHRHQASAARMFMLFFGGLVLAGILLIAMTAVLKQKGVTEKKQPSPASKTVK